MTLTFGDLELDPRYTLLRKLHYLGRTVVGDIRHLDAASITEGSNGPVHHPFR